MRRRLALASSHSLTCESRILVPISLRLRVQFRNKLLRRPCPPFLQTIGASSFPIIKTFSLGKDTVRRHMLPLSSGMFTPSFIASASLPAFIARQIVAYKFTFMSCPQARHQPSDKTDYHQNTLQCLSFSLSFPSYPTIHIAITLYRVSQALNIFTSFFYSYNSQSLVLYFSHSLYKNQTL